MVSYDQPQATSTPESAPTVQNEPLYDWQSLLNEMGKIIDILSALLGLANRLGGNRLNNAI